MIDALFNQPNLVAARRLLDLTALRHEAIAANLANIETPRYQRVDVAPAFERELQAAVAAKDLNRLARLEPQLTVDTAAIPRRSDGNTVDLEAEMLRLNRNSVAHAIETHLITGAMLKLRHAITGRS
jgi:flagellar basal-body rod protein FlgB